MLNANDLTNQKGYFNGTNRDIINGNPMVAFHSNHMGYGKEIAMTNIFQTIRHRASNSGKSIIELLTLAGILLRMPTS